MKVRWYLLWGIVILLIVRFGGGYLDPKFGRMIDEKIAEAVKVIKQKICADGSCLNISFFSRKSSGDLSNLIVEARKAKKVIAVEIYFYLDKDQYFYTIPKWFVGTETSSYIITNSAIRSQFIFDFEHAEVDSYGLPIPKLSIEVTRTEGEDKTIAHDGGLSRIKNRMPAWVFKQALTQCPEVFAGARQHALSKQNWASGINFQVSSDAFNLNKGWPVTVVTKENSSDDVGSISSSDGVTFSYFMGIGNEHPAPNLSGKITCKIKML